ncbi:class I adenylate-forming enzyme family protein [Halobacterium wangiae]|uniref:class I adenylate-forming enzyme family protein n=1 Tax=Halobacterium wangiae TaxID=2902623 RepID=UPI001E533DA1|nr:class I adenylate-forming enzyme family protein [Halobacterium wangiae]
MTDAETATGPGGIATEDYEYDREEPHTGVFQWYLERRAASRPDERAYTYSPLGLVNASEAAVTWSELNEEASRLAALLAEEGVEPGEFVATLFPPSPQFAGVYFAAAKLGATLVPLDLRGTPSDHQHVLEATNPVAFVGASQYRDTDFQAILEEVPAFGDIQSTHWLSEGYADDLPEAGEYEWTVANPDGTPNTGDTPGCTDPDAGLLVVFTSGTTGDPKGAVLTHRNVVFQGTAISASWGIDADDTVLVHLPTDHVGGATELMGSAVVGGADVVFLDAFDPGVALQLIESQEVSMVGNVPAMWGMLFNHDDYADTDLSSLEVAVVAGQAPSEDVLAGMAQAATHAVTGWGLTETGGFVTLTDPEAPVSELLDTVGRAFPGFEVRTVDEDDAFLPAGETGELVVRGDGVMREFLSPEHNEGAFVDDEWVHTGDLGFVDSDGDVRLRGRKKNMYISGGYNVYPPEIEETLADHPDVEQAMVIGVEDDSWGEAGHAFVLGRPGSDLDEATLEAYADEELADYKQPVAFTVESELPMTALGKIDRQAIIETYELDPV